MRGDHVSPADWAGHILALEKAAKDAVAIEAHQIADYLRDCALLMVRIGERTWPAHGRPGRPE